jgi:superoxide dismutase, Cu-Zn family
MRTLKRFPVVKFVCVIMVCGACSAVQRMTNTVAAARAVMYDVNGAPVGTAVLAQDPDGLVSIRIESLTLPAGTHGIHFHQVGKCEGGATAFSTAGGHFNPLSKEHGLQNPSGPHAGDAPNIDIPSSGVGKIAFTTNRVSLTPGATSLFDADGSSIVVHGGADDQMSQPAGNSGPRIACGVVESVVSTGM